MFLFIYILFPLGGVADCVSKLIFRQGVSPDVLREILQQRRENEPTQQPLLQSGEEKLEGNFNM